MDNPVSILSEIRAEYNLFDPEEEPRYRALSMAIEALNGQRWIPCSEQLPEEEEKDYWVCTNTGYQCQCEWTSNVFGIGNSDTWRWKIFDIPQYSHVVAWMPLPKPYEEGGDGNG